MFKLSKKIHCKQCGFIGQIVDTDKYYMCPSCQGRDFYIIKNPKFNYISKCNACLFKVKSGCLIDGKEYGTRNNCVWLESYTTAFKINVYLSI